MWRFHHDFLLLLVRLIHDYFDLVVAFASVGLRRDGSLLLFSRRLLFSSRSVVFLRRLPQKGNVYSISWFIDVGFGCVGEARVNELSSFREKISRSTERNNPTPTLTE